jgi:hypothetical protein
MHIIFQKEDQEIPLAENEISLNLKEDFKSRYEADKTFLFVVVPFKRIPL